MSPTDPEPRDPGASARPQSQHTGAKRPLEQPARSEECPRPPSARPVRRFYGASPSQYGDLYLAAGAHGPSGRRAEAGTLVVVHGGFWRPHRGTEMTAPLCAYLSGRGWNVWNIEYRRVGQDDWRDWRDTLHDCHSAVAHLPAVGAEFGFDPGPLRIIGHSAGGQLAAWVAGELNQPASVGRSPDPQHDRPGHGPGHAPDSDDPTSRASTDVRHTPTPSSSSGPSEVGSGRLVVESVVSLAGVLDLVRAARAGVGSDAVPEFLGGTPDAVPDRYARADPVQQIPDGVELHCVHSETDERVPAELSAACVERARRRGVDARLIPVSGTHEDVIDPGSPAWRQLSQHIDFLRPTPSDGVAGTTAPSAQPSA